ncbi:MAG: hypothetical protein GX445_03420 [Elusimicrobia bacterium]|nr:hypothetical protein [Elusimicrobiota bacterium]
MKYSLKFWIIVFAHGIMVAGYSISFPFLRIYLTQKKAPSFKRGLASL